MTPNIVSHDEWVAQRKVLLAREKEFTRLRDELARERRRLPWVPVEKEYVFDGPAGKLTLSELFGARSQLVVYHFMFGPGRRDGCPSCSFVSDHIGGSLVHLAARDVSFAAVSRATYGEIAAFKRRMGWEFEWVSSSDNDFNRDYHVSFSKDQLASGEVEYNFAKSSFPYEDAPGLSVFYRDESGAVYHTYSSYARGLEPLVGTYHLLDVTPKGRDEDGLPWPMAWVRHHDAYGRITRD
jgi:predicted dithiol-disulfide oxidoreductase (DUF899 family)